MSVAHELQDLVQLQQQELQKLQQQEQQQQHDQHVQQAVPVLGRYGSTSSSPWHGAGGSAQLEAANAELRQQLQGTTSRLQEMEASMSRLLEQQVRSKRKQPAQADLASCPD